MTAFGNGSSVTEERCNWEFWYPLPPFHKTFPNELGLHIHLSPSDTNTLSTVLNSAATAVGFAVANVFGAFAGVVTEIASRLVKNSDGSMDIHIAPDGFEVGNLPSADPNAWLGPAWIPVKAALEALTQGGGVPTRITAMTFELPHPNATSKGTRTPVAS